MQYWLEGAALVPVEMVPVARLVPGMSPRTDRSRSTDHIKMLAELDDQLPPLIVHRPTMHIIDGEHRLKAAIERGRDSVAVRFFDGNTSDAFALAVHANVTHGLALLVGERKAAAARLLVSHPYWSDRMIARIAGLSHKTVGTIRRRSTGSALQLHSGRLGLDGKIRRPEMVERRRTARRLIEQNPQMSLRQLAAAADISVGTARDVRNQCLAEQSGDSGQTRADTASVDPQPRPTPSVGRLSAPPSGSEKLLVKLRNDPGLRFTQKGREVLRRLSGSIREIELLDQLLAETPPHWRSAVADIARENAANWAKIADELASEN
ncbi:ParB/RepB/Spo0J family partition protein [Nocardia fusca]|uniref:ParB/RepB/Spo0J family partition protein n=1 Tax=Nocardia fusca TaxID=941183 RepID=UPI0018DC14F8|nr:ParB N-terminal domain-containing protein [Nocardia fusca]